ncbi:MAG: hypothetical protein HY776_07960, partial [Actinobacteria bacterium]|nr:hypothetical protein [Actinomycetota bacterium]
MKELICSTDKTLIQCKSECFECKYHIRDRRITERRKKIGFRFLERREDFDRRKTNQKSSNFFTNFIHKEAVRLRKNQGLLAIIIIVFNFLNLGDYIFTTKALAAGLTEINPVMNSLLATNPTLALAFKLISGSVVSFLMWRFRKNRKMIVLSLSVFFCYIILNFYHIFNAIFIY